MPYQPDDRLLLTPPQGGSALCPAPPPTELDHRWVFDDYECLGGDFEALRSRYREKNLRELRNHIGRHRHILRNDQEYMVVECFSEVDASEYRHWFATLFPEVRYLIKVLFP